MTLLQKELQKQIYEKQELEKKLEIKKRKIRFLQEEILKEKDGK